MAEEITLAEYHALPKRGNKYGAERVIVDNVTFASKREAERYGELLLLAAAGDISNLRLQPRYVLQEAFTDGDGVRHQKIEYVGDFEYRERAGLVVCEDAKGCRTAVFDLKWKLVKYRYPAVVFRLV